MVFQLSDWHFDPVKQTNIRSSINFCCNSFCFWYVFESLNWQFFYFRFFSWIKPPPWLSKYCLSVPFMNALWFGWINSLRINFNLLAKALNMNLIKSLLNTNLKTILVSLFFLYIVLWIYKNDVGDSCKVYDPLLSNLCFLDALLWQEKKWSDIIFCHMRHSNIFLCKFIGF